MERPKQLIIRSGITLSEIEKCLKELYIVSDRSKEYYNLTDTKSPYYRIRLYTYHLDYHIKSILDKYPEDKYKALELINNHINGLLMLALYEYNFKSNREQYDILMLTQGFIESLLTY